MKNQRVFIFIFVFLVILLASCTRATQNDGNVPSLTDGEMPMVGEMKTTEDEPETKETETERSEQFSFSKEDVRDLSVRPKVVLDVEADEVKKLRSFGGPSFPSFSGSYYTIEDMADDAVTIVAGRVENVFFAEKDSTPMVAYDLLVYEVFKGELTAPCRITVGQAGGVMSVETYTQKYGTKGLSDEDIASGYVGSYSLYFHEEMPEIGAEYVLFLGAPKESGEFVGGYHTMAAYHSKYVLDPETGMFARRNSGEREYYDSYVYDRVTNTITGEREQPKTLAQIRARLSAALSNEAEEKR